MEYIIRKSKESKEYLETHFKYIDNNYIRNSFHYLVNIENMTYKKFNNYGNSYRPIMSLSFIINKHIIKRDDVINKILK